MFAYFNFFIEPKLMIVWLENKVFLIGLTSTMLGKNGIAFKEAHHIVKQYCMEELAKCPPNWW